MVGRKRWRSPQEKKRRRQLIILCACLFTAPVVVGAAVGASGSLLPTRQRFGEPAQVDQPPAKTSSLLQRCLTGAGIGALLGASACGIAVWASRHAKR
jgi:hypothetical protein